jgi:hypothetical protein
LQVIDFPQPDFRILPQKGKFATEPFNVLVQWHGFQPNASGFVPLSIAEFSL